MTPEQLEQIDALLAILRKHRVAVYEGLISDACSGRITLRDDAPPSISDQLRDMPKLSSEEHDSILFHSAPDLSDLPTRPPGLQPHGEPVK